MSLETRLAKLESRYRAGADADPPTVKLARWLATTPWAVVESDCQSNAGLLGLANRLRGLSPTEQATALDAVRQNYQDANILTRVRNAL